MPHERESLLAGLSRCNLKGPALTVGKLLAATMPNASVEEIAIAAMREIWADNIYTYKRGLIARISARRNRSKKAA